MKKLFLLVWLCFIIPLSSLALVPPKTMCLGPLLNGTPCFNGTNGTMIMTGSYINWSDIMNREGGSGYTQWLLSASDTSGSQAITNNTLVSFIAGNNILITRNSTSIVINSTATGSGGGVLQGIVSLDSYILVANSTVTNISLNTTALAVNCTSGEASKWNGSQFVCTGTGDGFGTTQMWLNNWSASNIGNWTNDKSTYLQNSSNDNATKFAIYRMTSTQNDHAFTSFLDSNITNTVAANIVSTNQLMSAMWISGQENTTGTLKVTHNQPAVGFDLGAFTLSLLLNGNTTGAAGGIFIDKGNSTGDILSVQNGSGIEIVEMNANGSLRITSTDPGGNDFLVENAAGTDTLRVSTTSGLVRTRKLVPTATNASDIGDDTLRYRNLTIMNITADDIYSRTLFQNGKTVCLGDGTNCPSTSNDTNSGYTQWRLGSTPITNNTQVSASYGIVFDTLGIGIDNTTIDARNINVDNNKSGWLNTSGSVFLAINSTNLTVGYVQQNPQLVIDNLYGQVALATKIAYDKLTLNGSFRIQTYFTLFAVNNDSTGINTTQLIFNVSNTSWYPSTGTVMVDKELISYTNITGASPVANFTGITRALFGTNNTAHSSGAAIIPVLLLFARNETISTFIHLADGRTGINTSAPTNALEVNGVLNATTIFQGTKSVCLSDLTNCGAVGNGTITGAGYGLVLEGVKLGYDNTTFDMRSMNVDNNRSGWLNASDQVWLANNNTNISIDDLAYFDTKNNKISINTQLNGTALNLNGTMNVTAGNVSFQQGNGICLNENCSSRVYFNGTHTVIV